MSSTPPKKEKNLKGFKKNSKKFCTQNLWNYVAKWPELDHGLFKNHVFVSQLLRYYAEG